MRLQYKINLLSLSILLIVALAISTAGVLSIRRLSQDLNLKLMSSEVNHIMDAIRSSNDVLVQSGVSTVESYIQTAQQDLIEGLQGYSLGETGSLMIVTLPDYQVVLSDTPLNGPSLASSCLEAMAVQENGVIQCFHRDANRLFFYEEFQPWNWRIILSVTTEEMYKERDHFLTNVLFILLLSLILGSLVYFWFARGIVEPILELAKAAVEISRGTWNRKLPAPKGEDEVGELTRVFGEMWQGLSEAHQVLEEQAGQLKETNRSLGHEVAERKRAERALLEAHNELEGQVWARTAELAEAVEAAEAANAAKSDFLARMSHEIRTPLHAVTGLTSVVLKSELNPQQRDYLNKAQTAANNLLEVINDILDFSKVEAGRLELIQGPFDLDQLLEQLTDLFSNRVAQKDLELIFSVAPDTPRRLIGDGGRLTQVLTNLIENAVKFTDHGEIVIRLKPEELAGQDAGRILLRFRVSDSGIGIGKDVLPTLFDPFIQADSSLTRKHEGAGLGLAISRRLVQLMGGDISAESEPGKGSTFVFTVVVEAQVEEKPRFVLPTDLHGLKAMVVDDSPTARQVLSDLLGSLTFKVSAVSSGSEAIAELQRAAVDEPYRLILLDWKMEGMDGIATAEAIRNVEGLDRPPVVVMVTAYGKLLVQEHIDTTAVDSVLMKPVKASQLFNTVMVLFGRAEETEVKAKRKRGVLPESLAGSRILVVEDSELNREVAVALLEEGGVEVDTAEDGKQAVDKVTGAEVVGYDGILMDIQMPVMDGYEATKRIRQWEGNRPTAGAPLPIIALTAHALKGEREKCLAAGMVDYISKPIDERQLWQVLVKWIPGGTDTESSGE